MIWAFKGDVIVARPLKARMPSQQSFLSTADGRIRKGDAIYANGTKTCAPLDGSEQALHLFIGFAAHDASDGCLVRVLYEGVIADFNGLQAAHPYLLHRARPLLKHVDIATGRFARVAGVALSSTTLLVQLGPVFQRGLSMADPVAQNAQGSFVQSTTTNGPRTAVAAVNIGPGIVSLQKNAMNQVLPTDGSQGAELDFVGLSDGGTYLAGETVTFYPPGTKLSSGAALQVGDYWSLSSGQLTNDFAAIPSGVFTRRKGIAISATEMAVIASEIVQK